MAGIFVAAGMQRLLVEGRRADGVNHAFPHEIHGGLDVLVGGIARLGRDDAPGQVGREQAEVEAGHGARLIGRGIDLIGLDGGEAETAPHDCFGRLQARQIAHHQRLAALVEIAMGKAFHDDLGADAGTVAHGDRDPGAGIRRGISHRWNLLWAKRLTAGHAVRGTGYPAPRRRQPW